MTTDGTATGMAARDWGFLACRVLALYLFFLAVELVYSAVTYAFTIDATGEDAWVLRYYFLFQLLLTVAAGLVLWFGAAWLAGRMVPPRAEAPEAEAAGSRDVTLLLSLAVAVFGLALVIFAIPDAAGLAARYLAQDPVREGDLIEAAMLATRVVLGIVLVVGGRGIANLIGRARGWRAS